MVTTPVIQSQKEGTEGVYEVIIAVLNKLGINEDRGSSVLKDPQATSTLREAEDNFCNIHIRESQRQGIAVQFGSPQTHPVSATSTWTMAGWEMRFVQLAPHAQFALDQSAGKVYVKVITGQLKRPDRDAFAPARTV